MIRHPLDLLSLVVGVLSIAAAAAWFVIEQGYADPDDLVWAAPAGLVIVGAAGIAASLRRTRRP
jgi:hypothetical protein